MWSTQFEAQMSLNALSSKICKIIVVLAAEGCI